MEPGPTYLGLTGLGNFLVPWISYFPFVLNLRYYIKTKIRDYLFLVAYFAHWSIYATYNLLFFGYHFFSVDNSGFISFASPEWINFSLLLLRFVGPLDAIFLAVLAMRSKYGANYRDFPLIMRIIIVLTILWPLYVSLSQFFIPEMQGIRFPQDTATTLTHWGFWLARIPCYLLTAYCFLTSDFPRIGRSIKSRNLWISSSILWAWGLIGFMIAYIVINVTSGENVYADLLSFSGYMSATILMLINHIAFPESVLITRDQIHRAMEVYDRLELRSGSPISNFGLNQIKLYLDEVPAEFK